MSDQAVSKKARLDALFERITKEVEDWPNGFLNPPKGLDLGWERVVGTSTSVVLKTSTDPK